MDTNLQNNKCVKVYSDRFAGLRTRNGNLYQYAHFICDCLFVEILNNVHENNIVYREKSVGQTLGNFSSLYDEIMNVKNIELPEKEFNDLNITKIIVNGCKNYSNIHSFTIFRNYIFNRYSIDSFNFDPTYPKILLIERGSYICLASDKSVVPFSPRTGKEKREIPDIDKLANYLKNNFSDIYEKVVLENISFEKQIKYFNNAKIIMCAHGAAMANMFFCKEKTVILEVTCQAYWDFFNEMSSILNLIHVRYMGNKYDEIIDIFRDIWNKLESGDVANINSYTIGKTIWKKDVFHSNASYS